MAMGKGRLALFVLLGLGLCAAAGAFAITQGLKRVADEIRSAPGFAAAWPQAASNRTLIHALGPPHLAPFDLIAFLRGRQSWRFITSATETVEAAPDRTLVTRREEHNEIEVPITGDRGTGTLSIDTKQKGGTWKVDKLVAQIAGHAGTLDLLIP